MTVDPRHAQSLARPPARSTAVVGLQWGDEGKGKVVDRLAAEHDAIVRYNGGANAGHSVVVKGERYALHLVPSGILNPGKAAVIGNGVVVDPEKLLQELSGLASRGVDTSGLIVSDRAHVVLPYHKLEDELREEALKAHHAASLAGNESGPGAQVGDAGGEIGTTKRGIGPAYADKVQRSTAIRMGDLLDEPALRRKLHAACVFKNAALASIASTLGRAFTPLKAEDLMPALLDQGRALAPAIKDTTYWLHDLLTKGGRLLFEGANATLLDVDHGTYPFVTSSNCAVLGIGTGTGVSERHLSRVVGVMKAYSTRVGKGPMPTELHDALGDSIRQRGREFGTTTGRPRRVGWLDLVAVRYSAMVNAVDELAVMLLDVLGAQGLDELRICTAYDTPKGRVDRFIPDGPSLEHARPIYQALKGWGHEGAEVLARARMRRDMPDAAKAYIDFIERFVGRPVGLISVGPDREQTIVQ
jgi:adenylosuccinate synthase